MRIFLAIIHNATGFPLLFAPGSARHCCWHRNFQLSTRIFDSFLEFLICWINEVNTTQFSCRVKLRFFDSPLLLFLFADASDIYFQTSGHRESGLDVVCFLVSLSPDQVYFSSGFSSNIVNLVKLDHVSDNSRSPFQ